MFQVINPKFKTLKELKNLTIEISHYTDSVSVVICGKDKYVKYHKSYNNYDSEAIAEIKEFIKKYDDEVETKAIEGVTKLYFDLINYNW